MLNDQTVKELREVIVRAWYLLYMDLPDDAMWLLNFHSTVDERDAAIERYEAEEEEEDV
jgi:hypothetical protein